MSIKYNGGYLPTVGADGTTLVANSSASTGVSWAGPTFTAGKNKIINGDFGIWQRGTSFSGTGQLVYTADRWLLNDFTGVTSNASRQAFTAGAAPVSGYESAYYAQWTRASSPSSASYFQQKIEDVRTFAGQTVTISFWAQSGSGTPTMNVYIDQNFGTGGSSTVNGSTVSFTLSTSWQRYTTTIALSSISGKTIGTGSSVNLNFSVVQAQGAFTINLWGVQVEAGSVATPFTTASGTFQGELALCQRYYQVYGNNDFFGQVVTATSANFYRYFPVSMRVTPTPTAPTGTFTSYINITYQGYATPTALSAGGISPTAFYLYASGASGLTIGYQCQWNGGNVSLSAEL